MEPSLVLVPSGAIVQALTSQLMTSTDTVGLELTLEHMGVEDACE
jgi:hypothetical protein